MAEDMTQLKLLTIGDSGVGKTWLLLRWAGAAGKLSSYASSMPTIGIDFKMKTTIVNGRRIKVQVVGVLFFKIFSLLSLVVNNISVNEFGSLIVSGTRLDKRGFEQSRHHTIVIPKVFC
mmetsp:Transcript_32030/g.53525  ORF Transcript_32030/g.53525 Transcript_32030/m.53525 type:complete len:119 (+) Transcript_32030:126-482(+)